MPRFWVSGADFEVASHFIELLSGAPGRDGRPARDARNGPRFEYVHVPSLVTGEPADGAAAMAEPIEPARRIFRAMRADTSGTTNLLIGSQVANFVVEPFVAELFGCEPFADAPGVLPFYLYRPPPTRAVTRSCFGGADLPAGGRHRDGRGIYYKTGGQRWSFCPSRPNVADAGIAIVRRVPGRRQTELAIFGYSSQATRAMGTVLRRDPDRFWGPMEPLKGGVEARVYLCRFCLRQTADPAAVPLRPRPIVESDEVIALPINGLAKRK